MRNNNQNSVPQPVDNAFTRRLTNATSTDILSFSWQAHKNGEITHAEYEQILDIVTRTKSN